MSEFIRLQQENEELCRKNARLAVVIEKLRAELRDCMSYVECDNLTMQTKHRNWQAVLDGKSWKTGNVDVAADAAGDSDG